MLVWVHSITRLHSSNNGRNKALCTRLRHIRIMDTSRFGEMPQYSLLHLRDSTFALRTSFERHFTTGHDDENKKSYGTLQLFIPLHSGLHVLYKVHAHTFLSTKIQKIDGHSNFSRIFTSKRNWKEYQKQLP